MAESVSNRFTSSINVMSLLLIRAICTNGLGRWLESASTTQANHSSSPTRWAPVRFVSTMSSHQRPSAGREIYQEVPVKRAGGTSYENALSWFSAQENLALMME